MIIYITNGGSNRSVEEIQRRLCHSRLFSYYNLEVDDRYKDIYVFQELIREVDDEKNKTIDREDSQHR